MKSKQTEAENPSKEVQIEENNHNMKKIVLGILENKGNQREGNGNRDGQQDGGIFRDRSFFLL